MSGVSCEPYSGRITPLGDFLSGVLADLADVDLVAGGSDQYRRAEVEQVLDDPGDGLRVSIGTSGAWAPGRKVQTIAEPFQTFLLKREIKTTTSLLFAHGLASAAIARDGNGNPSLLRSGRGRIDLVSAAVLAAGLRASAGDDSDFSVCQRSVE